MEINDSLSRENLQLLCFYAFVGDEVSYEDLSLYAKYEKTDQKTVVTRSKALKNADYVTYANYDWMHKDFSYRIKSDYYFTVLRMLHTTYPEWERKFKKYYEQDVSSPFYQLQKMTLLALEGKSKQIPQSWFTWDTCHYMPYAGTDPQLSSIFLQMPIPIFQECFESTVLFLFQQDKVDTENILPRLLEAHNIAQTSHFTELRDMLALYRYYSHGEYTTPTEKPRTLFALLLEAVRTAYAGKYEAAISLFEAAMKLRNKESKEKNILTGIMNSYALVMTYIHLNDTESAKKLQQFLKKKVVEQMESLLPARTVGCSFSTVERTLPYYLEQNLIDSRSMYVHRYFGFLFARYFGSTEYKNLKAEDFIPRQAILRHELSAYLPLSDQEREELKQRFGSTPLLTSIRQVQKWELVLDELLKEEQELSNPSGQPQENKRLSYIIRYGQSVEVREQEILKSGKWGSGKVVSMSRYQSGNIECMDEADRRIWERWRNNRNYQVYVTDALPELVGSDRIFIGPHAPFDTVEVTEEKPYLVVEKEKNGNFRITSNYTGMQAKSIHECKDCLVVQKDETHYTIVRLKGRQRKYYNMLLSLEEFPAEAEKRLQAFFPQMSHLVEVHSQLIEGGSTLETIDGGSIICLQVRPVEGAFRLQMYAKPLPEGKALLPPGKGMGLVVDEKEGKRYQVKRHLSHERDNYEALCTYIEESFNIDIDNDAVTLPPEAMLDLLEYLQPLTNAYMMEWPEGEKMRLRTAMQPSEWNISLQRKGEWLEMEGDVQLDHDTILSMEQLLEYIGQSRSRFIRLNETDYLCLSDTLRKQLGKLESVTVKNRGKMQISKFQAGLLGNDVLNGEITIHHDASLDRMRQKIAESRQTNMRVPSKLNAELRDYQIDGFRWIARLNSWGAGACLADDMGLGKTVQTIAYLLYKAKEGASLVVAPASVVPNWRKELQRFAPSLGVQVLNDCADRKQCIEKAGKFDVVLSTYGLLVSENEALTGTSWNVVCLDEAHTIKNRETKTSACAMQLRATNRLILTGTPIQNHLGELWNLFQFINPGLLGSYEQFQQKYILPIEQEHDKTRQQQLNRIVHPFMLRRTKREVVEELPDKQEIIFPVELSEDEMRIYEVIRRKAKAMLEEGGKNVSVSTLSEITKLRQAACAASLVEKKWTGPSTKIEMLTELLAELKSGGNRALIFSQFTSFLALARQALNKAGEEYLYLDGSTPMKQREQLVQEFQHGECPFFLISLKAGGLGLNLTGANYIIHLDPWWNPAIEQQATDRAYRIGQEQKVTAYHLIATHTIEEKIMRLHDTKRNLADALLEGTDMSHKLTAQELMEMLEEK